MDKATMRKEIEAAVAEFVAAGGVIEQIKARKNPPVVMRGKAAKGTTFNAVMDREVRTSKMRVSGQINSVRKPQQISHVDIFA